MTRSTFWRCTRSRYSLTCRVGPPASSINTRAMGAPPSPGVAYGAGSFPPLIASASNSAPLRAGTPNGPAAGPERKVTSPIFTGLASTLAEVCAPAARAITPAAMPPIQLLDRARRIPFFKPPAFISHLPDVLASGPHLASPGSCQGVAQSAKQVKTPFRVVDFAEVACYGAPKLEYSF